MNEVKKMRRELRKYKAKLQERVFEILNQLIDKDVSMQGLTLTEIGRKALEKPYLTKKEVTLMYQFISAYRKIVRNDIIWQDGKYGFPSTKEQAEEYATKRMHMIVGNMVSVQKMLNSSMNRLGYSGDTRKFIEDKMDDLLD